MAKILVVDDSPSARALTGRMLAEGGHSVVSCATGTCAIEQAARCSVDLIVTDIYMPEKDGLEIIAEVRKLRPRIPVIAVSGASGPRNMLRTAKVMGAACILRKPFSKRELLLAVAAALTPEALVDGVIS